MVERLLRLLALSLALLCAGSLVHAQTTTRVVCVTTDVSGAIVQAAAIEIRNLDVDSVQSGTSDGQGRLVFDGVPPGRYMVTAASPGLEPAVRHLMAAAGKEIRADLVLDVPREEAVVVVTAAPTSRPLVVETDPQAPQQPVPASDGADYLKTIPGISVVRKGGTDGDPMLRGMAGSRLGILLDGQQIYGGCGGRMDPPTAYVFPSAYDRVTVFKGPQTTLRAAGASAGVVMFERNVTRVGSPDLKSTDNATIGAFGRRDVMGSVHAAVPSGYFEVVGTRSHSDDYQDGSGSSVHSLYTRWSGNAAVGWTPDSDTVLELSGVVSDGEAAYADRGMDGTKFARDNVAVKFDRRMPQSFVRRIEAQSYYNYIDHVMDNYTLRTPGTMYSANNPDRRTVGGRAAVTLALDVPTSLVLGADTQGNRHTFRGASGKSSAEAAISAYTSAPRVEDMRFSQVGVFGEATRTMSGASRLIGGFRTDWHEAVDSRACVGATTCPGTSPYRNLTAGATDRRTLVSGFGRYEQAVGAGGGNTIYVGVGHAERSPDYWERKNQDQTTLNSVFVSAKSEKTTQLDTGVLYRVGGWSGSVSAFYGKVRDYLLIRWSPSPTLTRNVDVTTMGGEADLTRTLFRNLKANVSLAYVHADNDTDGKPLAQQPATEGRLALQYDNRGVSVGALARVVAAQNRVDVGSGNIVSNGKDIGPTSGFSVFSVNAGYRFRPGISLTGGVDNLSNKTYAEHISQAGAMVPGFVQTTRVNEPGRTAWVKLNLSLD